MNPSRINLNLLRSNPKRSTSATELGEFINDTAAPNLTRRSLLKLGGLAAVSSTPLLRNAGTMVIGPFELRHDASSVEVHYAGHLRWRVDIREYSGQAVLNVQRTERAIDISVRDARFAGTDIPADFKCCIKPGLGNYTMHLSAFDGAFDAECAFEQWLLGLKECRCAMDCNLPALRAAATHSLMFQGRAFASYLPNNSWSFEGKSIATLSAWKAESGRLSIRPAESQSYILDAAKRKTRIVLERGSHTWDIDTNSAPHSHWNLVHDANLFDYCVVDCCESTNSRKQVAFVFESDQDEASVALEVLKRSSRSDQCTMALRKPRYALLFSPSGVRSSFVADFGDSATWLHQRGISYQLGAGENTPPFEMHGLEGRITKVQCQPRIVGLMPHIGDVIASPVNINDDVALSFSGYGAVSTFKEQREQFLVASSGLSNNALNGLSEEVYSMSKGASKGFQIAKLGSQSISVKTDLSLDSLSIIRPQDLLVLTFYYDNFSIRGDSSGASLVPTDASKASKIIVEFQPQNIIEQAFYQSAANLKKSVVVDPKTGVESGVSAGPDNVDSVDQPPVKARIAGKSRLAFSVPKGSSVPLTLDGLLSWEKWTPILVPVAQRQDTEAASSFHLYTGLLSYLAKQGISFKQGSLINEIASGSKSLSMDKLEGTLNSTSLNKLKSSGIEYSSTIGSSGGVRAKRYKAPKSGSGSNATSDFKYSFNYGTLAAKYNLGLNLFKPQIREPEETETALEIPYRLMLSPLSDGGWAHAHSEKTRSLNLKRTDSAGVEHTDTVDFTELWHTRLWFRTKNKDGSYSVNERDNNYLLAKKPKLRAVWSPDFVNDKTKPNKDYPTWDLHSLTSVDRWSLVVNSSDYYTETTSPTTGKTISYDPKAIDSEKLFLSSIGAWIDVHGAWDPVPSNIDLVDWIHRGTMGREHYVRVMYRGYLFPFGHKCTLVKITERKFGKPKNRGTYGAYMRQHMFVIVRQADMTLDDTNTLFEYEGREMPFKKVHIKTKVTPDIDDPNKTASSVGASPSGSGYPSEFYIRVVGEDFKFHCTGTDWDGNELDFVMPMAFVSGSLSNTDPAQAKIILSYFNGLAEETERRKVDLHGARLAYGPSKTRGDTTFETSHLILKAGSPSTLPKDVTWFYPALENAVIRHQDVEQMSGSDAKPQISFVKKFLESGFDSSANAGEAFLKFLAQVPMSFGGSSGGSSDKSGGFISPNQAISGLSRAVGPISGQLGKIDDALDKFSGPSFDFDPADFLGAFDAKLFGVISLFDIIQAVTGSDPRQTLIPQLLSKAVPGLGNPADLLNTLKNSVMKPITDAYNSALADATATSSTILAKLQEMKDLIDGLQSHVTALETAISSASGTGDIFTALTTTLPEFLNWISTNIGPLGVIPQDAMSAIQEVAKVLENMQNGIRIGFDWKPLMQADEYGFFVPQNPAETFALSAYALLPLSNKDHSLVVGDPTAKVEGYIKDFSINLIPTVMDLVSLPIVKMGFSAEVGKKSDIYCNLGSMEWRGPLSFMNELQKFIPLDGFVDPPSIDVDMTGIKITFDLAIPTISVGVFAITNISLGAGLTLPFLGDSMLFKFEFCKKDSPFHVTYMMLGGGGYFGLTLSLDGVEKIEAAIEIGAELALDFGVASGNVSIFAGIYFSMEGDVMTLQGYVKIHGEVDVLGLISASLTLELTITYISTGKLYGTATMTVEIHLFIFSASVDITVEKYFKGSAGDPTIAQMVPDELYPGTTKKYFEHYIGAFA